VLRKSKSTQWVLLAMLVVGPKARMSITAGGLAFSATIEKRVRAFDNDTGKVLWMTTIPDAAEGAPAIYEIDGREFVVFCVRGSYIAIAYALPAKG
jgi:quinoprotein glucose dehydrogenase